MEPKELKDYIKELRDYIKALMYIGYVVLALFIGFILWVFLWPE